MTGKIKLMTQTVTLMHRTTWRCGRVERVIVNLLLAKKRQPVSDIVTKISGSETLSDEVAGAFERLERRYLITLE